MLGLAMLQAVVSEGVGRGMFSIAGGRDDAVTFLLDEGLNNNLPGNLVESNPNPDTVAEFRILTSNYSAEYGRSSSGIVSVVTKSGTNALHDSAFEFLRNDALNANTFFSNRDGVPREILKRNQSGFAVGGPVEIPKVVNGRDRSFFDGHQRQRLSNTQLFQQTHPRGIFERHVIRVGLQAVFGCPPRPRGLDGHAFQLGGVLDKLQEVGTGFHVRDPRWRLVGVDADMVQLVDSVVE